MNGERVKFINYKLYINTIKKAFMTIQDAEKNAQYHQEDKGDFIELKIVIPKNNSKTCLLYTSGPFKGSLLGIKRILKCHPFHEGGYDPLK